MGQEKKKVKLSDLLRYLENGVTRLPGDVNYDPERGSIKEKYDLSEKAVRNIFNHPLLKNKKVRVPVEDTYELIDDVSAVREESEPQVAQEEQDTTDTPNTQEEEATASVEGEADGVSHDF